MFLNRTCVDLIHFQPIVAFVYLPLAARFGLSEFKAACSELIYRNIRIDNVLRVFVAAQLYDCPEFMGPCVAIIRGFIGSLMRSDDWSLIVEHKLEQR